MIFQRLLSLSSGTLTTQGWSSTAFPTLGQSWRLWTLAEGSDVRCPDQAFTEKMRSAIYSARKAGDTLGGVFTVISTGVPVGLGSHVQWDRGEGMSNGSAIFRETGKSVVGRAVARPLGQEFIDTDELIEIRPGK